MGIRFEIDHVLLRAFCLRWRIREMAFFGSVIRDDFSTDSDVDVLVSFDPDARWSLLDLVRMEDDLETVLGRRAEISTRSSIEQSENWIQKRAILDSAEVIYAA
jgi:hypothetical protein